MSDVVFDLLLKYAKIGWHASGFFFLQLCIGLLLFSSVVEKVRARIVAPAREAIRIKDAEVKGMWSAYREASRDVRTIFFGFSRDSGAAVKQFDKSVEEHLVSAEKSCKGWLILALLLHLSGWPHWMGASTLLVVWPIVSLYRKVATEKSKAIASITEFEKGLKYCSDYLKKYCDDSLKEPEGAFDEFFSER